MPMTDAALFCAGCEYDLRTLDSSGLCPECATPIAASIAAAADPLRAARPSLRSAATVLLAAATMQAGLAVTFCIYDAVHRKVSSVPYDLALLLRPWQF